MAALLRVPAHVYPFAVPIRRISSLGTARSLDCPLTDLDMGLCSCCLGVGPSHSCGTSDDGTSPNCAFGVTPSTMKGYALVSRSPQCPPSALYADVGARLLVAAGLTAAGWNDGSGSWPPPHGNGARGSDVEPSR